MTSTISKVASVVSRRALQTASPATILSRRIGPQLLLQRQAATSTRGFSTAAAAMHEDEPVKKKPAKSKRRRTLQAKDPIIVTERAADRIKELLSGESAEGSIGIILGVKRRGCNGLSYTLNYAFEEPKDASTPMTSHGINVFIEPMALFSVVGTTMDYETNELTSEFTFNNPNSKGECGCGESFNV